MDNRSPLPSLMNQWWLALSSGVLLVMIASGVLFYCCPSISPLRFSLQAALVIVYILYLLQRNLKLNRPGNGRELSPSLGPANWITLARGGLIALLAGFWLQPWPGTSNGAGWTLWMPGIIYLTASAGDVIDGYVARQTAHQTLLGEFLDTRLDALGILTASLVAVHYGQLPDFYISAGLAYYLLRLALWLRKKTGRPCNEVKPRKGARWMAGAQMVFLAVVLLPLLTPPLTHVAAGVLLIPFLAGFLIDWQVICHHERFNHVHREI